MIPKCCCFELKTGVQIISVVGFIIDAADLTLGAQIVGAGSSIGYWSIVSAILSVITNVLLFLSALKEERGLCLPWLVYKVFHILSILVIVIVCFYVSGNIEDQMKTPFIAIGVFYLISAGVIIYLWIQVARFFRYLGSQNHEVKGDILVGV